MKTIKFIDPETFEEKEQQFDDFHYELAKNIESFLTNNYQTNLKAAKTIKVFSNKEGDRLIAGLIRNRNNNEIFAEKYKITIEKFNDYVDEVDIKEFHDKLMHGSTNFFLKI